jgi:3-oxoacyl-[acyl-carrier-protein] synthase II
MECCQVQTEEVASIRRGRERRVVVTGMGVMTSLGSNTSALWEAILDGRSGVRQIRQFDSDAFPVKIGSEIDMEDVKLDGIEGLTPYMSRAATFGVYAMEQAWEDAGLTDGDIDPWRSGVCIGAWNSPSFDVSERRAVFDMNRDSASQYLELCRQSPDVQAQRNFGAVSTLLSMRHALHGPSICVQTACASATQAIGEAYQAIRLGDADVMVCGGTDSMLSVICVSAFTLLNATSFYQGDPTRACRPFDRKRDGLVLGEGAGILVLEELEHARRRGARIHAELLGYGSSCDGYRFTDAHPAAHGPTGCMAAALADAGIPATAVDYINAHGTATPQNDPTETMGIKRVFGDHAYKLAVSSTKSQLGHLMCATGGVELILTVLAMQDGIVPPTMNLEYPDPDCDLDYVPNRPRQAQVDVAVSNSFGFGGQNGSLVVGKWDEPAVSDALVG